MRKLTAERRQSDLARRGTPAARGYRMPAEWERHEATWVSWPHNRETWPGCLDRAEAAMADLVAALTEGEHVHVNVLNREHRRHVNRLLGGRVPPENLTWHDLPTDDAWIRDHGAVFVVRDAGPDPLLALDFEYNAWGGKYPPYDLDRRIARRMADALGVPCRSPRIVSAGGSTDAKVQWPTAHGTADSGVALEGGSARAAADSGIALAGRSPHAAAASGIVLEGGSIDVNGAGAVLTTGQCLLNDNRNPGLDRAVIESVLADSLGATQVIWLGDGIAGDDTDGHIDNLARFVDRGTVVTAIEPDSTDPNHAPLALNRDRLASVRFHDGTALDIIELPMPAPVHVAGSRLPASYANFYIGNEIVAAPAFACAWDEQAQGILADAFPGRRIVPIDCTALAVGLGALHCLTQQVPAVPVAQ